MTKQYTEENTEIYLFFSPQRKVVSLRDKETREVLTEWIDADVKQAVINGILNPRDYHKTALRCFNEARLQPKRQLELFKNI